MLERVVEPETLDTLAADDPRALRSRRDLRRVNRVMGSRVVVVKALRRLAPSPTLSRPLRVLELGSGDGHLMLGVARDLGPAWRPTELTLLDRQALVSADTIAAYGELDWSASEHLADVLEWASAVSNDARFDVIVTNLFLHHFRAPALARLCAAIAARCDAFFACEPSRSRLALAGSHLIGALGANAVTREDAVTSVRAGFSGAEISALWPACANGWQVSEFAAGLFSHGFLARRSRAADAR